MSMAKRMGNKGSWVMYNVGDMVRDFVVLWDVFVCICILFYIVVIVMELDTSCRFLKQHVNSVSLCVYMQRVKGWRSIWMHEGCPFVSNRHSAFDNGCSIWFSGH